MSVCEKKLERGCPICRSAYGSVLGRLSFALFDDCPMSSKFDVVVCRECSFVFYDTPDAAEQFKTFYQEHYFSSSYTSGQKIAAVDAVVNIENDPQAIMQPWLKPDSHVCEVGCGRGTLLEKMKRAGYGNVYGVEPSNECVEYVKTKYGIDARVGTADSIPFKEKFDVIISTHVFEHVLNLDEAVSSITQSLADDGMLYVEVPDLARYASLDEAEPIDYITFYEHINHFTIESLSNLFKSHKYGLIEYGRKILNKGTRLPLPAVYGVFKKNAIDESITVPDAERYDVSEVRSWLSGYTFQGDEKLEVLAESQRPVYVWGINLPVQKLMALSALRKCNIAGLLDRDPLKQQKTVRGTRIQSPEILKAVGADGVVVIWGGPYSEAIQEDIKGIGFKGEVVIL